jgi:hypothetical protein
MRGDIVKVDIELLRKIMKYPSEHEYIEKLYDDLVDKIWWRDSDITNDTERQKFLYEAFIEYYNVIINGEVKETEENENIGKDRAELILINKCKMQLDKEIRRVQNKDYTKYDEE